MVPRVQRSCVAHHVPAQKWLTWIKRGANLILEIWRELFHLREGSPVSSLLPETQIWEKNS